RAARPVGFHEVHQHADAQRTLDCLQRAADAPARRQLAAQAPRGLLEDDAPAHGSASRTQLSPPVNTRARAHSPLAPGPGPAFLGAGTMRIVFLAEGNLFLKEEGRDAVEIESQFAREASDRATARNDRHAWKNQDRDEPGNPYAARVVWGRQAAQAADGHP